MPSRRKLGARWDTLQESLWFYPAVALFLSIAVAEGITYFDNVIVSPPWFTTNADSARSLLGAIATATLTLTGLVFSITMLVLQLTSSQLSPRVMRRFLRDRHNQVVLALFIATFAYALLALRNIDGNNEVPTFSVWLGFIMSMVSVAAFIHYINHMAHSIQTSAVIAGIGDETRAAIERMYPDPYESDRNGSEPAWLDAPNMDVSWDGHPGVLTDVDIDTVGEIAQRREVRIAVVPMVGDFVPTGTRMFHIWGALGDEDSEELQSTAVIAQERTMRRDVAFGLRQLVDIAERALSPGVNDPTTAVQAIDQIHDLLRRLAAREIGSEVRRSEDGRGQAVLHHPEWDALVTLAVDEIRLAGRSSLQTNRRLRFMLEDVLSVAPPTRQNALRSELARLDEGIEQGFDLGVDQAVASKASARGHGD